MGRTCHSPFQIYHLGLALSSLEVARDAEGFLVDLAEWNEAVATEIARELSLELSRSHWELIYLIRQFYNEFDLSPAMRPLVKYAALHLGADKGTSLYFLQHFPGSPAKFLAKIAGLPKPENCL